MEIDHSKINPLYAAELPYGTKASTESFIKYCREMGLHIPAFSSIVGEGYHKNFVFTFPERKKVLITGCQGRNANWKSFLGGQDSVARAMKDYLKAYNANDFFGMLLGDNVYDAGVSDVKSNVFQSCFSDIYPAIPFFSILGNHDWSFYGESKNLLDKDRYELIHAQVCYTYYQKLQPNKPSWNMPNRYYALDFPEVRFFMLDSSTYCFDIEQQKWLRETYDQLTQTEPNKWNILVMHHPLHSYGKRGDGLSGAGKDIKKYMLQEYYGQAPGHRVGNSMNQWLRDKLFSSSLPESQRFKFDLHLCAHDHFLANSTHIYNEHSSKKTILSQILVGGGGSPTEDVVKRPINSRQDWISQSYGFLDLDIKNTHELSYRFHVLEGEFITKKEFQIRR